MNFLFTYSIYFTGGLTRGPKYHDQTFFNLQISPQYRKNYSFSFIGIYTKNIILIYDCISYVYDPDSAGSLGSGPSLVGASTYGVCGARSFPR